MNKNILKSDLTNKKPKVISKPNTKEKRSQNNITPRPPEGGGTPKSPKGDFTPRSPKGDFEELIPLEFI